MTRTALLGTSRQIASRAAGDDIVQPTVDLPTPAPSERGVNGHSRRNLTRLAALEQPTDILSRVAAGIRAATIHKILYDDYEASIVLGVSPETLKVWRREGRGPAWVRLGDAKLVRYPLKGLQKFAASLKPYVVPIETAVKE